MIEALIDAADFFEVAVDIIFGIPSSSEDSGGIVSIVVSLAPRALCTSKLVLS